MTQNSNQTFGEWLRSIAEAAIIGAIFLIILKGFVMLAACFLPKDENGQPNGVALIVVALGLLVSTLMVLNAVFWMPNYHSIVNAPPAEQRAMMQRKCILQTFNAIMPGQPISPNEFAWAHCVAIDAPDLPTNMQGWMMYNRQVDARDILSKQGIRYRSSSVLLGQISSNDPTKFSGPTWMWADGTRPRTEKYWYF
jgi:hypothetical protein